jgi:hypothetical protein
LVEGKEERIRVGFEGFAGFWGILWVLIVG